MANPPVPTDNTEVIKPPAPVEVPKTKKAWVWRLLIIVIPLLLLLGLVAGGSILLLGKDKVLSYFVPSEEQETDTPEDFLPEALNLVTMDIITAELYSIKGESRLISLTLSLDAKTKIEAEELSRRAPIIQDAIIIFMRGLRPEDFVGNAGIERVRNEITRRVIDVIKPIRIHSLFIQNLTFSR